jgi:hypothetical protein
MLGAALTWPPSKTVNAAIEAAARANSTSTDATPRPPRRATAPTGAERAEEQSRRHAVT